MFKADNMLPKVSVIIPVYNTEPYLRQCLDSIVAQTLTEIEIICVDDGSSDNSLNILKEYETHDSRITILKQKNGGGGVARNLGMTVAKGKYLSFLDSDDFFDLNMLKMAYDRAERDHADVTIFQFHEYNNKTGKFLKSIKGIYYPYIPKNVPFSINDVHGGIFHLTGDVVWNKLYNRDFINKNQIKFMEISNANDAYFSRVALCCANRISILERCLLSYRIHVPKSTQSNTARSPLDFYSVNIELRKKLSTMKCWNDIETDFINVVANSCVKHLSRYSVTSEAHMTILSFLINEGFDNLKIASLPKSSFQRKYTYWYYKRYLKNKKYFKTNSQKKSKHNTINIFDRIVGYIYLGLDFCRLCRIRNERWNFSSKVKHFTMLLYDMLQSNLS